MAAAPRLHRSELCVPGSSVKMLEKAAASGADFVMLDLEDAVAPDDKEQARGNVIDAINEQDWGQCALSLRINGLDTHWCYRDLVDVVERAGARLTAVVAPKVSCADDVHFVDVMLTQIEEAVGIADGIAITVLIETAAGMFKIDEIAQACPNRLEAMVFGVADYSASMQSHVTTIGGSEGDYAVLTDPGAAGERERHWGDQWHYALSRIAVSCRANGLRPIDGPFGDFNDPDGFRIAAGRAAILGFEGKWAIHPSQVELANEVFSPSDELADRTRRIIAAMEEAARTGAGAVSLDGRLIDAASLRQAQHLLSKIEAIEARRDGAATVATEPAPVGSGA
ncbi:MAG: CoA ester lyase [Actinomycetota bacterium]|nr:CoA ester lyase [Actinomycetota bacterium]